MNFEKYKRVSVAELHQWSPADELNTLEKLQQAGVSVSQADIDGGSPKIGDMIARNPNNHSDLWLIEATYFKDNFIPDTNVHL